MKKRTTEEFIEIANKIHNFKYSYEKTVYTRKNNKVIITCPIHGDFEQLACVHINSKGGCPKCGRETSSQKRKLTTEEFIRRANEIHHNKYSYEKTSYTNANTKVIITCPIHGDFTQKPSHHMNGHGCPHCKKNDKDTTESFIKKAKQVHGNKYDYSKVNYVNTRTKVCIICPTHGEFWQTPNDHISGAGCLKCAINNNASLRRIGKEEFVKRASEIHNNKYEYADIEYTNEKNKTTIICPIHGVFTQRIEDHLQGCGCPSCAKQISKDENEICNLLGNIKYERHNRTLLNGKEIDIYIPSLKLGIEYHGLRWHTDFAFGRDRNYHIGKLNQCNSKGVSLIQIFEDEWIYHKEIVKCKLKHILGIDSNKVKIFARKCNVEVIDKESARHFLSNNHIQGYASASIYLGLFYNKTLVAVMSFLEEKKSMWNLNRFATDIRYNCVGAGGKLFKYFTTHYAFKEVKSFADRRWTTDITNNLYTTLGFSFDKFTKADYTYYNPKVAKFKRFHKFGFRKQILHRKYGLPLTMTETEMVKELGYDRIWDCGLIKYVYYNHGL